MIRRASLLFLLLLSSQSLQPQSSIPHDAAEIKLELKKLTVLGSVLYIGAHPDDVIEPHICQSHVGKVDRIYLVPNKVRHWD